jgi:hypothetical protein
MRRRAGFTAVELAVCLSISAILVPSVFLFVRHLETTQRVARWHLETASAVQRLDEALQRDAQQGAIDPTAPLAWGGACPVQYAVNGDSALERHACGGTQVLATGVGEVKRVAGGVEVTFVLALREDLLRRSAVFLALEAR